MCVYLRAFIWGMGGIFSLGRGCKGEFCNLLMFLSNCPTWGIKLSCKYMDWDKCKEEKWNY